MPLKPMLQLRYKITLECIISYQEWRVLLRPGIGEFWEIYKLDCVVIPTNRDISRSDMEDKVYKTLKGKFNAVIDEIEELRNNGRPILVGTTSDEFLRIIKQNA